jgi:serine phosphatase RsbU (regulator of sigma subunit)
MRILPNFPEEVRKHPWKSIVEFTLRLLGFIGIPFILFSGLLLISEEQYHQEATNSDSKRMEKVLGRVSVKGDIVQNFNSSFNALAQIKFRSDTFFKRLQQIIKGKEQALEVYLFNEKKKCLTVPFLPKPAKFVANKFLKAVFSKKVRKSDLKWVKSFAGYGKTHKLLRSLKNRLIAFKGSEGRSHVGLFLCENNNKLAGYILVFLKKRKISPNRLLDTVIAEESIKNLKDFKIGWWDPVNPDQLNPKAEKWDPGLLSVLQQLPIGIKRFQCKGLNAVKAINNDGATIFCVARRRITGSPVLAKIGFSLKLLSVVIGLIFLLFFVGFQPFKIGLRLKIIMLFAFGAGVSIAVLIGTGLVDRDNLEAVLLEEYRNKNIEMLLRTDEGLLKEYSQLNKAYGEHLSAFSRQSFSEFKKSAKNLNKLFKNFPGYIDNLFVAGKDGTICYRKEIKPAGYRVNEIYAHGILETCMGKIANSTSPQRGQHAKIINSSGRMFYRELMLRYAGKVTNLSVIDNFIPVYINLISDPADKIMALICAFHSSSGIQRNYLYNISKSLEKELSAEDSRLVAIPIKEGADWPAFPKRRTAKVEILKELAETAISTGIPVHRIGVILGQKYLFSGIKGSNIDGYALIAAQPYAPIKNKISKLNRRIVILSVAILGTGLLLGWVTSTLLLVPLKKVNQGLFALNQGNFRHRIKSNELEEFSQMSRTFNKTLEGLLELRVAKGIQELLWPEKSISGPGWELDGKCRTATELGGDHFEWFELEDGRILITIGDVAGHGVASAMVQASTKIWMALKAYESTDPAVVLSEINRLHVSQGVKKLPMLCWMGIFCPETKKIEYASAGASYPVFVDMSGESQHLKLPGMPLGIRKKLPLKNMVLDMSQGGSLILYTDGIIECTDSSNNMLGFERFLEYCKQTANLSASDAIARLFQLGDDWSPGQRDDDQTLVILKVDPAKEEAADE